MARRSTKHNYFDFLEVERLYNKRLKAEDDARARRDAMLAAAALVYRPVNNLPYELLTEIFTLAVTNQFADELCLGRVCPSSIIPMAGSISQVCQRWRALMLGTWMRHLWSYVFVPSPTTVKEARFFLPQVSLCLERSGDTPLRIIIHIDPRLSFGTAQRRLYTNYCNRLLARSTSWSKASIVCSGSFSEFSAYLHDCQLPMLTHLRLAFAIDNPHGRSHVLDRLAPHLQCVEMIQTFHTTIFSPGWSRVTRVRIGDQSTHLFFCLLILLECPRIEDYQFAYCAEHTDDLNLRVLRQCPRVKYLRIIAYGDHLEHRSSLAHAFAYLQMPMLESLQIDSASTTWHSDSFLSFLSSSPLETLELKCNGLTEWQLIRILERVPWLLHLKVYETVDVCDFFKHEHLTALTDELILRLTVDRKEFNTKRCLVPLLQTIDLQGSQFLSAYFVDMIRSRWFGLQREDGYNKRLLTAGAGLSTVAQLESVKLHLLPMKSHYAIQPTSHPEVLNSLGELEAEGLTVEITVY